MKYNQAIALSLLVAGTLVAAQEYGECTSCVVQYKDQDGNWGYENDDW